MGDALRARGREQRLQRLDAALHVADVDALRRIPAVRVQKIVLRVDDDERRPPWHEVPVRRLEGGGPHVFACHELPFRRRVVRCAERITRPGKV